MVQPELRESGSSGGLVSRRVQMYEHPPDRTPTKKYFHRPQDSFSIKADVRNDGSREVEEEEVEARDEKLETRDEKLQESHDDSEVKESRDESEALESREEVIPPPIQQNLSKNYIGKALVESGVQQYHNGEYDKALKSFNTALKTQMVSVGDDHIIIALTLGNIGVVQLRQGNLNEAEKALKESLEMKSRLAPHMILSDLLNNLGNCACIRGDYRKSLDYYRQALRDLREKRGMRRDVANTLFNIGRLEVQKCHWDIAMDVLSEAWRMSREAFGENDTFVAQTMELLGYVQLCTEEYDSAMVSFTGALSIYRHTYGPVHMEIANALYNVAMVREAKGELAGACDAFKTARDLLHRLRVGKQHPALKAVVQSLARTEKAIEKQNHERQERLIAKNNHAKQAAKAPPRRKEKESSICENE